jgi:hypothetical protein
MMVLGGAALALGGCVALDADAPPAQPPAQPVVQAPLSCPEPAACVCPEPEPMPAPVPLPCRVAPQTLQVFGGVEWVLVGKEAVKAKARIDTGAKSSSVGARNITEFERDGKTWVKFTFDPERQGGQPVEIALPVERRVRIKGQQDERRFVVKMLLVVGDVREIVEVSLSDRRDFDYPVLVGRNFLTDNAVVDVSRKFIGR